MRCRLGITTGRAFVGDVGNQERREYAMVGDIVVRVLPSSLRAVRSALRVRICRRG